MSASIFAHFPSSNFNTPNRAECQNSAVDFHSLAIYILEYNGLRTSYNGMIMHVG